MTYVGGYTDRRHFTARFAKGPSGDGWANHRGSQPPVTGSVYIETAHKTEQGWAIGPRRRADFVREEEWATAKTESGAIHKWRLAPEIAPSAVGAREPPPEIRKALEEIAARVAADEPTRRP